MCDHTLSEIECKIIKAQIERRAKYRQEFLKLRTDPCKHSQQAGFVFDEGHQRYISMKVTQFEYFKPTAKNALFGIGTIVIPMCLYGYLIHKERSAREAKVRSGELRYRDRIFKLC